MAPTATVAAAAHVGETSLPAPSSTSLPAHLVANAYRQTSQDMNALHQKLAALYSPEQFEPTPINPNLQLSMQENSRLESEPTKSLPLRERSDSLEFDKIFDSNKSKPPKSSSSNMDELSQQLSNMSFSVGDIAAIQDEGNLSSLFEDSLKIKEGVTLPGESGNKSSRSGNNNNTKSTLNISSLGPHDMSMSTFGGESLGNLQSMKMSNQSFTHVFEESTDKV
jgi:hypothetical protein